MQQLSLFNLPNTEQTSLCIRIPNPHQATKLRQLAAAMQETINAKKNPAIAQQRPTHRRLQIAEEMYEEAKYLEQIQSLLCAIADAASVGELPDILKGIYTKNQLEILKKMSLNWSKDDIQEVFDSEQGEYSSWKLALKRANIHNYLQVFQATTALAQLLSPAKEDPIELQIRRLEADLVGMKFNEFFPTPRDVCNRLVELAHLAPEMRVLEPSAGKGDIAQAILQHCPNVQLDVVEIQSSLRKILQLKGFNIIGCDFLTEINGKWQTIIMNPPFSKFIEHTRHAHKCLVNGGKLITIAPESIFFRNDRKYKEFRQWLEAHNAADEKLPSGAFLNSINSTGVATRILIINK